MIYFCNFDPLENRYTMEIVETGIADLCILKPRIFDDPRGYFFESFNDKSFRDNKLHYLFVQDNESKSHKGVARGFHYQLPPYAQAKLVRVIKGSVQDVVIDLRPDSETKGQSYSVILSEENKLQMLIPRGFAHAFLVLEDDTIFSYKCDNYYSKEHERGISILDKSLDIAWEIPLDQMLLSDKDKNLALIQDAEKF